MWVMNINSIPQRRRGTGSVILSPQMSMQVNKQMHGTRINGETTWKAGRAEMGGGGRKGRRAVVPKRNFTDRIFGFVTEKWFE